MGTLADATLDEVSGLAASRINPDTLWAVEDSGAEAVIHALHVDGTPRAVVRLGGVENTDFEALALGPCAPGGSTTCLYVGDIGDNLAARPEVRILRVEEPQLGVHVPPSMPVELDATPTVMAFTYPGGPRDAEALVVDPRARLHVLTKRMDSRTEVFSLPAMEDAVVPVVAALQATLVTGNAGDGLGGAVTAADTWPDGSRLLIRTYFTAWEIDLVPGTGLATVADGARFTVELGVERQGETLAYDVDRRAYWHVSEGAGATLYRADCAVP